jgi:Amt family ammonium transporter
MGMSRILFGVLVLLAIAGLMLPSVPQAVTGEPINAGDTAWMLTATALVLLMTPGLSFFYGGMVRRARTCCPPCCRASSRWG